MRKLLILVAAILLLAGCKAGPLRLSITPNPITVKVGQTVDFHPGVENDFDDVINVSKIKMTLVDPDHCVNLSGISITGLKEGEAEIIISYSKPDLSESAKIYVSK